MASSGGHAKGISPLHYAIFRGKIEHVEDILSRGGDINCADDYGQTPLHMAAYRGSDRILRLLLEYGADPQVVDNNGNTVVHAVVGSGSVDALELLRNAGAPCHTQNKDDKTPADVCRTHCPPMKRVAILNILDTMDTAAAEPTVATEAMANEEIDEGSEPRQQPVKAGLEEATSRKAPSESEERSGQGDSLQELALASRQQTATLQRLESQINRMESLLLQLCQRMDGVERALETRHPDR